MAKIKLSSLKDAISELIDEYGRNAGRDYVDIKPENSLYWAVPHENLFVRSGDQPSLSIGNFNDDWEFLEKLEVSDDPPVALLLMHLHPLLAYITCDIMENKIVPGPQRGDDS